MEKCLLKTIMHSQENRLIWFYNPEAQPEAEAAQPEEQPEEQTKARIDNVQKVLGAGAKKPSPEEKSDSFEEQLTKKREELTEDIQRTERFIMLQVSHYRKTTKDTRKSKSAAENEGALNWVVGGQSRGIALREQLADEERMLNFVTRCSKDFSVIKRRIDGHIYVSNNTKKTPAVRMQHVLDARRMLRIFRGKMIEAAPNYQKIGDKFRKLSGDNQ